jgi:PHD/YefM family antitoxin component YafN of YafNO toxin-antitoxin module
MTKQIHDEDQDYLSITEARRRLPSLPDRLREKPAAIAITKREKPVLAIMPWDLYESIIETLEIMGEAELMEALRKSIRDVEEGRTFTMEEIELELKL